MTIMGYASKQIDSKYLTKFVLGCRLLVCRGRGKWEARGGNKVIVDRQHFQDAGKYILWLEGNIKIDLESFGIRRLGCWKLLTSRPWFISTSLCLRIMEIPCWPLKKTLRRVFPTPQENMREECFEAAQELEISFVREILFDWSQEILHLHCRWFAIPLESMNTISFVNGHKKWYWHAEKEAEQSKKDEQCESVNWKDVALTNPLSEKRK